MKAFKVRRNGEHYFRVELPRDFSPDGKRKSVVASTRHEALEKAQVAMIQSHAGVRWRFSSGIGDYAVTLFRVDTDGKETPQVGKKALRDIGEVHVEDYGIILRGPHPQHAGRLLYDHGRRA